MNRVRIGARVGLLCFCAASLGACTSMLFRSKLAPPVIYQLATAEGVKGPAIGTDLEVLTPLLRTGLDTDRIAASYPDHRMDYFAGAHWSGRLDDVVGQLAVRQFRARSGLRNVVGAASRLRPPYWLEIEVTAFQAEYPAAGGAPAIRVHLVARLGDARSRATLGSFAADVSRVATANRLTAIVAAFDAAADDALDRIISATDRTLRAQHY